jgi:hypothetical protein
MTNQAPVQTNDTVSDFERHASEASGSSFGDLIKFLGHTKKWWLTPLILILLLVGVMIILGGTALAPFIYPLF